MALNWSSIKNGFDNAVGGIKNGVGTASGWVSSGYGSAVGGIKNGFSTTVNGAKRASMGFGSGVKNIAGKVPSAWDATKNFAGDASLNWKYSPTREFLGKSWGGAKKITGKAAIIAVAAGAATYALMHRQEKKYESAHALADMPLPPAAGALPETAMAGPAQPMALPEAGIPGQKNTLMGMEMVEGDMVNKLKMERGGLAAGVNPGNPGLMDIDGTGQVPQALGR